MIRAEWITKKERGKRVNRGWDRQGLRGWSPIYPGYWSPLRRTTPVYPFVQSIGSPRGLQHPETRSSRALESIPRDDTRPPNHPGHRSPQESRHPVTRPSGNPATRQPGNPSIQGIEVYGDYDTWEPDHLGHRSPSQRTTPGNSYNQDIEVHRKRRTRPPVYSHRGPSKGSRHPVTRLPDRPRYQGLLRRTTPAHPLVQGIRVHEDHDTR